MSARRNILVAAVTAMFQSLLEGKTDCPISGVLFGAGKTLSAAAMIAGLLVMDPSLKIMIVTKENVAAHAFAKHFLHLGLPDSINSLVGRLVGYVELQKGPASKTDLDIPPAFRNDVLRGKQVIIGCGGGFHQECSQPYSPVAKWMEDADVALNDEGQQYGNLDEASAVVRTPRKCLVIWCGNHKQTPGGLRKTDEARAFRRKLLRRPIALRGDTEYLQPNMLGEVLLRYLEGMDDPFVNQVKEMLRETVGSNCQCSDNSVATLRTLCQEVGCSYHDGLCVPVCSTAISVLWLALHKEKFPLLANSLQAAAGVIGKQKWALILPSSARVSLVTYTAVIAVRYPELDHVQNDLVCFGNYLLRAQSTHGGFLPIFWDAPAAYIHAATDIGSAVDWIRSQYKLTADENGCLAVLHNRNKMVAAFGNSEWATQSEGSVISKSVTSCAGMTAHFVLLAQTKVGFLSGGRSKKMKQLPDKEVAAQLEEAYARATVALTRAQKLCIIMGPLDMRGLMGAATVIGSLKYGAGVCGMSDDNPAAEVYLKEKTIDAGPDDSAFIDSLRRSLNTPRGAYPPVALAEIYREKLQGVTRIRRLHLIVVDLERTRCVSTRVYHDLQEEYLDADPNDCLNTLPVPYVGPECSDSLRYIYGYGIDGSDRPSYLLWPCRGEGGHFWLTDPWSGIFFDPATAAHLAPMGLEHFFDAFALTQKRSIRRPAAAALRIPDEDISDGLVVRPSRANMFDLTPIWVCEEPPTKRARTAPAQAPVTSDVKMAEGDNREEKDSSEDEDSDSSGSNSDFSSDDASSEISDLDHFDEAYTEFRKLTEGIDPSAFERVGPGQTNDDVAGLELPGGLNTLRKLANVPKSWPLARLTIPLSAVSKHLIERLVEGYCMEVVVSNYNPEAQLQSIKKFAKDLVLHFAMHIAEKISSLMRHVLDHPTKILYDPDSEVWILPLYRELLNTASRHRPTRDSELRRSASGLVKVICRTTQKGGRGKGNRKGQPPKQGSALAGFHEWFGSVSMMNILYVWFPASWGPSVMEAIQKRNEVWVAQNPVIRDPQMFNNEEAAKGAAAREMTYKIQKWNVESERFYPILVANARVDWLALKDEEMTQQFPILLEGILQDVFSQKIVCMARCPTSKAHCLPAPSG